MRVCLLYRDMGASVDGIRDYTRLLSEALASQGADVSLDLLDENQVPARLRDADALIVQYNPFSYGRWGVAPWLPFGMWRLKRGRPAPLVAIMVHEPYMPLSGWREMLMGVWQRLQMVALRSTADITFVSIDAWVQSVRRWGRGPVHHLPVGSTLPDMRAHRPEARIELGIGDETTVVAAFGTDHPSRLTGHVGAAAKALHDAGHSVVLLNLGAGAPVPDSMPDEVRVETPGRLDPSALAVRLSAADVFAAPFVDGVSSRRSTFIAALQHGLPIVGTDGSLTDGFIRTAPSACRLVPVGSRQAFARAMVDLADEPGERQRLAQGARLLYEQRFAWPVLADRLVGHLQAERSDGNA